MFIEGPAMLKKLLGRDKKRIDILKELEGVVPNGEMLCVLGPPGSGCSTLLKTIAGDTYGFHVDKNSALNYQGIRPEQIRNEYRGEAIYTAEVDNHFAHLTAGDTLYSQLGRVAPSTSLREWPRQNMPSIFEMSSWPCWYFPHQGYARGG